MHACPSQWSRWLSLAKYWHNFSSHSALGRLPFEVLYGYPPWHFGLDVDALQDVPDLHTWMQNRELMQAVVKQHLLRANARMKRQADKHRFERQFAVGDSVFLKLQPYVQSSLARRSNNKLAFRFFGPFKIIQRIGAVAYKLELPASAAIHNVFHVSQLKSSAGSQQVSPSLPSELQEFQVPARILQRRWTAGDRPEEQGLVQWSQSPPELATWEPLLPLRQQFPRARAWGHAGSEEEGGVSAPAPPAPAQDSAAASAPATPAPWPKRERRPNARVYGPAWNN